MPTLHNALRFLAMVVVPMVTIAWVASAHVHAQVPAPAGIDMQEGVVVSAGMGKLVVSDAAGKQHTHAVDESTKITVHGKPGRLEDLKLGMQVRVMLDEKNKAVAVATVDEVKNEGSLQGGLALGRDIPPPAGPPRLL